MDSATYIYIIIVAIILIIIASFVYYLFYHSTPNPINAYQTRKTEKLKRAKYLVDTNATYVRMYVMECSAKSEGQNLTKKYLTGIHKQGIVLVLSDMDKARKVSEMMGNKLTLIKEVIDGEMTEADALTVDNSLNEGIANLITDKRQYSKNIGNAMSKMSECALSQAKYIRDKMYKESMDAFEQYKAHSRTFFTAIAQMILNSNDDQDLKV